VAGINVRLIAMKCPICKREVPPAAPGVRIFPPFCSERCKLVDLGRWLGGHYQIPVEDDDEDRDRPRDTPADDRLD
jgi:endogenous inhibitor of DNA gyrase (YacG/DUF329 family)